MDSKASASSEIQRPAINENSRRGFRGSARALAKKIIPDGVVREIRRYRRFKKPERIIYLKLRIAHGLGLTSRKVPTSARSFVFVCFGNIMRSPIAEVFFRQAIAQQPGLTVKIASAGLNATPGKAAHPWAVTAAEDFGFSLADHQAKLLTRSMVDEADAILAMDFQNQVELLTRFPDAAEKVFLLGSYSGASSSGIEIRDPFFGDLSETRDCYRLLQRCVNNLASTLNAGKSASVSKSKGEL